MGQSQFSVRNTWVSKNGFRPHVSMNNFYSDYEDGGVYRLWIAVGQSSDTAFMADENGSQGTLYPSGGSTHSAVAWSETQTSDTQVFSINPPRIAVGQAGISTGLTTGAVYILRVWGMFNPVDPDINNIWHSLDVTIDLPNESSGSLTSLSAVFSNNCIDTTGNVSTDMASMQIDMMKSAANLGGTLTNPTIEPMSTHSRIGAGESRSHTTNIVGANAANLYWKYRLINLVTEVSYKSNMQTIWQAVVPSVHQTAAYDITASAFKFDVYLTPIHMSAGVLSGEISTSSTFASSVTVVDTFAVSDAQGVAGAQISETVAVTGLSSSTVYYFRARIAQTEGNGGATQERTGSIYNVTTSTIRKAVKTPANSNVGYFFKGDFSAFRKLRVQDKPEFSPQWKTAVVINGTAYLGNVKYLATDGSIKIKPDRILKSLPNAVDTFTKYNFIDVAIEDGDDITALSHIGERLLEFKRNSLYVINVGQDYDFLEASHKGIGIMGPYAICSFPQGVAFVNTNGVYVFDGQQIVNLLQKDGKHVIRKDIWSSFVTPYSSIGYIQEKNMFVITDTTASSSAGNCYLFDLDAGGWIYYKGGFPAGGKTNFIYDGSGRMLFANSEPNSQQGIYYYPQISDGGNNEFEWRSGEIDFGDATSLKKIYEVTVSYANYGMAHQPSFYWSDDSGRSWKVVESGVFYNHNDDTGWYNASFKLISSSSVTYVYPTVQTLMLKITAENITDGYTDFKLNEVSIEFRMLHKRITASSQNTTTDVTGQTGGGWQSSGADSPSAISGGVGD